MPIKKHIKERIESKKKRLDSLRPLPKAKLEKLKDFFDVELTYNSTSIEGNSLSLRETRAVLEDGVTIGGKSLREHLEITNHKKAIDFVESLVKKKRIKEIDILNLHAIILDRISPREAGFYRNTSVYLRGSKYIPPPAKKIPNLMKEFVRLINKKEKDTVEHAAMLHFQFVHMHPFTDGNGRAARLFMNLFLMRNGYPPAYILNAERKRYIDSLEKAHFDDFDPFLNFMARAVDRSLSIYLDALDPKRDSEYITLAQASKICLYSQEYLSLLARKGRLDAIKFGRNWMISKKALKAYTKSVSEGPHSKVRITRP